MLRTAGFSIIAALACLTTYCTPSSAQSVARLPSGAVDTNASRVYVFVDKTGLGHAHGVEGRLRSGSLKLDAKTNAGQLVFDMTTFTADTDEARKFVGLSGGSSASTRQQVSDNMLGADVLDAKKHPTATFDVHSALPLAKTSPAGNRIYALRGTFNLHGVGWPLTIEAEAIANAAVTRLRGVFTIQQTKFGITPYSTALGAVGVADALKIWGDIVVAN